MEESKDLLLFKSVLKGVVLGYHLILLFLRVVSDTHGEVSFALTNKVEVLALLSLSNNDILREEKHRLELTNEETLLHTTAVAEELNLLYQRGMDAVKDLLAERVV